MAVRRNTSLVALDVGRATLRLFQVDGERVAARELPCEVFQSDPVSGTPDAGGLGAGLRAALADGEFRGARCSLTLPASCFLTDTAPIAELEGKERMESLAWEAVDRFGLEREAMSVGALRLADPPPPPAGQAPLPPTSPSAGPDHLLMAVRRTTVSAVVDPVIAAGLVPVRLECAALAGLRTAWAWWRRQGAGPFGFVHVEPTCAWLLLVRDGTVAFQRASTGEYAPSIVAPAAADPNAIPVDMPLVGSGRRALKWSGLADEVLQCLRHVERKAPGQWPSGLMVSGPSSGDVELHATLESVCGVKVHPATCAGLVHALPATLPPGTWAAALGAAAVDMDVSTRVEPKPAAAAAPAGAKAA